MLRQTARRYCRDDQDVKNVPIPSFLLTNARDNFVRPRNIAEFLAGGNAPFNISSLSLVLNLQTPAHVATSKPRQDAGTGLDGGGGVN